nr:carboxypeptidase regulatory-like domain-containing protein [Clostridia bacterium]
MLCTKLICSLMALMMMLSLVPAAMAEATQLKVELYGLYAAADGSYQRKPVAGTFEVYQNDVLVGTVDVSPEGENTIILPGAADVRLAPVAGTYPAELELNAYGYGLSVVEGRLNIAPISAYTKAAQPAASPAAEPTVQPTAEPTAAPTAVPTAVPTATPVPTAVPTEVPETGTLTIAVEGDEGITVACTVMKPDGANVAKGTLTLGSHAVISGLHKGEYIVTVNLPADAVMTAMNGQATLQRGVTQWKAVVNAMQESVYTIELTQTGDLVVPFENVEGAKVLVTGERESFEVTANAEGVYEKKNLLPDMYEIKVNLPAGRYEYADWHENWTLTENDDGTCTITMSFGINADCETELPLIKRNITGSVSGKVVDLEGDAMSGVEVAVCRGSEVVAQARTDKSGRWQIETLTYGDYVAQYTDEKYAIPSSTFALNDANVNAELSAAAEPPAKITVRVFVDENNNGSSGRGEDFLKGVEVSLVDEKGVVAATGLTNRDGYVTLAAADGKYRLRAVTPEDYGYGKKGGKLDYSESIMDESAARTQESDYITLRADATVEAGIGVMPMATVRGTVWKDVNADGVWQDDEPGIPGIRMTLKGGKDKAVLEAVTDANGVYEFRQVKKGNFELNCHVPDEYVFTVKAKGEVEQISRMTTEKDRIGEDSLSLDRGEVHENHNIGLMDGLIIEGRCFLDENYNGQYDEGEKPLPGVEMRLARQSNNVMLQNVISAEDGTYKFVGQRGSTFTIRANLPKGYVFTHVGTGDNGNQFAPNGDKGERRLTDITIENGGYKQVMLGAVKFGAIHGRVYYDKNFSSDWESGEALGIELYVSLYDEAGQKLVTRRTDENGLFTFDDLVPGTYYLGMNPTKGYAFTALGKNNVMITQADGTGMSRPIALEMGERVNDAGIGMIVPAIVTGKVFADDSDNGMLDAGEKGLKGTVVRLMGENGEVCAATVGENAEFRFNAVLPGTYYLQYELPEHGVFARQTEGGNTINGENGVGKSSEFSVNSGDTWNASLCGGVLLSDITGMAYADANGSAHMDDGEGFVPGLEIALIPNREDMPTLSAVTGADGKFAFHDVRPDTYTLRVTCPGRYVLSRLSDVEMPLTIGKATQDVEFRLEMGTQWLEQMLGIVIPASWTGEAWLDGNWDGVRGADEAPANGETIQLRDAATGEIVFSVLTDDNGVFSIDGIAPGEYELVYPMDEGSLMPKDGCDDFAVNGDVRTNGRVTILTDEKKSGTNLCVVRTTEIGGMVWLEEFSGVTPVKGAKLHLLDASGKVLAEQTTGEDGTYVFKGLMPADYSLDVTIPSGYVLVDSSDTKMAEKGLYSFVEDAEGAFGKSAVITLRMAKHRRDMDVGMVLPGRLGDKAWLDLNGNGLQDGEEGGIPGVTIEVMRGDKVVATVVTDQYGYYTIKGLYPTEYILRVTWPAEVKPAIMREDIKQISSVLKEDGTTVPVTVQSNKANYAADLGFVLIEEGKLPAGYGEGTTQNWKK